MINSVLFCMLQMINKTITQGSMADLAEAVVRGDILVDEIDVIEAVEKGRLSATDGARFSAILEEYSKLHRSINLYLSNYLISGLTKV